ncbi:hypothetical protein Hanom_Chr00s032368g01770561 [Helianthus anomalus]
MLIYKRHQYILNGVAHMEPVVWISGRHRGTWCPKQWLSCGVKGCHTKRCSSEWVRWNLRRERQRHRYMTERMG